MMEARQRRTEQQAQASTPPTARAHALTTGWGARRLLASDYAGGW
jgi:hypothetical protein